MTCCLISQQRYTLLPQAGFHPHPGTLPAFHVAKAFFPTYLTDDLSYVLKAKEQRQDS